MCYQLENVKKLHIRKPSVRKTAAQKLRDYLKRKYGNSKNIFIRRETDDGIRVPDVQGDNKEK